MVHNQANVHMLCALVLFIREEYDEYSSCIAVCMQLDALWLEGVVINQALQVGEEDPLQFQGALWWCKADVPKVEGLIASHHVLGQRLWTLEVVQEMLEVESSHLQEEKQKH